MQNILLLTATIQPKTDQPELAIVNPKSVSTTTGIVFIDNSGYDLRCLSERFTSERIEWISFYDLDYPNNYHQNLFLNWSPDGRKGLMSSTRAAR